MEIWHRNTWPVIQKKVNATKRRKLASSSVPKHHAAHASHQHSPLVLSHQAGPCLCSVLPKPSVLPVPLWRQGFPRLYSQREFTVWILLSEDFWSPPALQARGSSSLCLRFPALRMRRQLSTPLAYIPLCGLSMCLSPRLGLDFQKAETQSYLWTLTQADTFDTFLWSLSELKKGDNTSTLDFSVYTTDYLECRIRVGVT